MAAQKIFGLIVTDQKIPYVEKAGDSDQCYICGFKLSGEDCLFVFVDTEYTDKRKIHQKCLQNHLQLLPKDAKIAIISFETNEVIAFTPVKE